MEKRVVLAVVLCVVAMFIWFKVNPPAPPVPPAATSPTPSGSSTPSPSGAAPGAAASPTDHEPEQELSLASNDVEFVFSTWGGTLRHARLLGRQFLERPGDRASGHDVVSTLDTATAPLRTTFPDATFAPVGRAWQASRPAPDTVLFVAENDTVRIEKRYRLDTTRYRLQLDLVVHNKTDKSEDHALAIAVAGRLDPEKKGGGFFSGAGANQFAVLCAPANDKPTRKSFDKIAKESIEVSGAIRWVAADEKFFVLAAVPYPEPGSADRACKVSSADGVVAEGVMRFRSRTVAPREATTYSFSIFAGPKFIDDLDAVKPGDVDARLSEAVDVTLAKLSYPILLGLKFFHRFAHNWGLAIILLTLFIKLATFPFTQKSLLSAKKMQKLAPKMNAIRKKYENDRQRQSVETMNLYKANGVSPFGGCLPSLIQMPIWIALYSTLNYAVELYRAPFVFHIHDLTAKDPFYVTPLLMGGVMFLQMRMSPASPDNEQQKMMQVMMPIMFTAFSLVLPSGLALYMLTSYLIGILQQLYVNYVDRKSNPPGKAQPA